MSFLYLDSKLQCVATLVTFEDENGKPYIILGRNDPRYKDWQGTCLQGKKLPVGPWQFFGGHAEYEPSQPRHYWNEHDPQLVNWPEQPDPHHEGCQRPLNKRIARNALKELDEEAGISAERFNKVAPLRDVIKHAQLEHLSQEAVQTPDGATQDVHYLRLNLGRLSSAQITALQETVQPGDDMIQSIIIPADRIYRDERHELVLRSTDGHCNYKTEFTGFHEMPAWDERFALKLEQATSDEECAAIKTRQGVYHAMHHLRGLMGIDEASLYRADFLGFLNAGKRLGNNESLTKACLKSYHITPPLMPRPSSAQNHTLLAQKPSVEPSLEP